MFAVIVLKLVGSQVCSGIPLHPYNVISPIDNL